MDVQEGSVAHRNFTALAAEAHSARVAADALTARVSLLEQHVAQQDAVINELRGAIYSMRGTGATT
jgi:hypothetical protein